MLALPDLLAPPDLLVVLGLPDLLAMLPGSAAAPKACLQALHFCRYWIVDRCCRHPGLLGNLGVVKTLRAREAIALAILGARFFRADFGLLCRRLLNHPVLHVEGHSASVAGGGSVSFDFLALRAHPELDGQGPCEGGRGWGRWRLGR